MEGDRESARGEGETTVCAWHQSQDCMSNGYLILWQQGEKIVPPAESPLSAVEIVQLGMDQLLERGVFCTIHSLLSWLQDQGAMTTPKSAMTQKRPGGGRKTAEQRPTVATRQPRRSLAPRRSQ